MGEAGFMCELVVSTPVRVGDSHVVIWIQSVQMLGWCTAFHSYMLHRIVIHVMVWSFPDLPSCAGGGQGGMVHAVEKKRMIASEPGEGIEAHSVTHVQRENFKKVLAKANESWSCTTCRKPWDEVGVLTVSWEVHDMARSFCKAVPVTASHVHIKFILIYVHFSRTLRMLCLLVVSLMRHMLRLE